MDDVVATQQAEQSSGAVVSTITTSEAFCPCSISAIDAASITSSTCGLGLRSSMMLLFRIDERRCTEISTSLLVDESAEPMWWFVNAQSRRNRRRADGGGTNDFRPSLRSSFRVLNFGNPKYSVWRRALNLDLTQPGGCTDTTVACPMQRHGQVVRERIQSGRFQRVYSDLEQ